eukprot:gene1953-471_t
MGLAALPCAAPPSPPGPLWVLGATRGDQLMHMERSHVGDVAPGSEGAVPSFDAFQKRFPPDPNNAPTDEDLMCLPHPCIPSDMDTTCATNPSKMFAMSLLPCHLLQYLLTHHDVATLKPQGDLLLDLYSYGHRQNELERKFGIPTGFRDRSGQAPATTGVGQESPPALLHFEKFFLMDKRGVFMLSNYHIDTVKEFLNTVDAVALGQHTLDEYPDKDRALVLLAKVFRWRMRLVADAPDVRRVGNDHFKKGEFAQALAKYRHAVVLDGTSSELVWNNLALTAEKLGWSHQGFTYAKTGARLRPKAVKPHVIAARCADSLGLHREAARYWSKALQIEPANGNLKRSLEHSQVEASLSLQHGADGVPRETAAAEERLVAAFNEGDMSAQVTFGRMLLMHKDTRSAGIAKLEDAATVGTVGAHYSIGMWYLGHDEGAPTDLAKACGHFQKVLSGTHDPSSVECQESLHQLGLINNDCLLGPAYLRIAALSGNVKSLLFLGQEQGRGLSDADLPQCYHWFGKAASYDRAAAASFLADLLLEKQMDKDRAAAMLREAATAGSPAAKEIMEKHNLEHVNTTGNLHAEYQLDATVNPASLDPLVMPTSDQMETMSRILKDASPGIDASQQVLGFFLQVAAANPKIAKHASYVQDLEKHLHSGIELLPDKLEGLVEIFEKETGLKVESEPATAATPLAMITCDGYTPCLSSYGFYVVLPTVYITEACQVYKMPKRPKPLPKHKLPKRIQPPLVLTNVAALPTPEEMQPGLESFKNVQ